MKKKESPEKRADRVSSMENFEASKRRIKAVINVQANLNELFPNLQIDVEEIDGLSEAYVLLNEVINNVVIREAKFLSSSE